MIKGHFTLFKSFYERYTNYSVNKENSRNLSMFSVENTEVEQSIDKPAKSSRVESKIHRSNPARHVHVKTQSRFQRTRLNESQHFKRIRHPSYLKGPKPRCLNTSVQKQIMHEISSNADTQKSVESSLLHSQVKQNLTIRKNQRMINALRSKNKSVENRHSKNVITSVGNKITAFCQDGLDAASCVKVGQTVVINPQKSNQQVSVIKLKVTKTFKV